MQKTSVIFGGGGQDASYLAELLIDKDNEVICVVRRSSLNNRERIEHIKRLKVVEGDITDAASVSGIISEYRPDEIYNLAAQSHVHTSFEQPSYTFQVNTLGVINILEAVRNICPQSRFIQASTSEMFGNNASEKGIQDEYTKLSPVSPYAVSKTASHQLVNIYREAYNLYVCSVTMFNHESPRRATNFVTRKITKWIGRNIGAIKEGKKVEKLKLGNIHSSRDWSHAKDFMRALTMIMEQDEPDNYVLCSGKAHTVQEFLEEAFGCVNLDWTEWVEVDEKFMRPLELHYLCGKLSNSVEKLNWKPEHDFKSLVKSMVIGDISEFYIRS